MTSAVGIVGTGSVAQALGRLLLEVGAPLIAMAGSEASRVHAAARFAGGDVKAVAIDELPALAGRIVIATRDDRIGAVARTLAATGWAEGVALHTCGAQPARALTPLDRQGIACGVLHPLQTVVSPLQGVAALRGIAYGVSGDAAAIAWAQGIVRMLGSTSLLIPADRLPLYHAGAVMASNAMVAVLDAAARLMDAAGVGYDEGLQAIAPLSRTTVTNALASGPRAALTGPVVRGDSTTVAAHAAALGEVPVEVGDLYRSLSRSLISLARERGLGDEAQRALRRALNGGDEDES